jgi:LPXTG-motif cell wall-anchored protein
MVRSKVRFARRAAPSAVIALGVSVLLQSAAGAGPTPVGLGTATSFAVLAGAGITNTGPTTITGDTGTFPTPSETGFNGPAPDFVTFLGGGVDHADDAVTQGAKSDLLTAYDDAAGRLPEVGHAVALGGDTLTPGVYSNGTFGLTGTLTLDFQNDVTASFIFKTATTLITAVNSSVVMINADANAACRIAWKVGSSATFGTGTQFKGDVLVKESITANTGATFIGRLLARDGAVTLDTNTIDSRSCVAVTGIPTTTTSTTATTGNNAAPATTTSTTSATTSTTSTTVATATTTPTATTPPTEATTPTVVPETASAATPPTARSSTVGPVLTGLSGPGRAAPSSPAAGAPNVPGLPRTGDDTLAMAMFGAALVVVGGLLLAIERRRRPGTTHS